jgi:hypothetical protein
MGLLYGEIQHNSKLVHGEATSMMEVLLPILI